MTVIRSIYDGFTESDIATRTTLAVTITQNGNGTVSFNNVSDSMVKTMLTESTTGVAALSNSTNVNQWSGFGPYSRSISAGAIVLTNLTSGKLGEFMGYNHSAPTPAVTGRDTYRSFHSGITTVSITAFVDLGEVAWYAETGAKYIVLEVYQSDGTTFVGRATYDLSTRSAQGILLSYDYSVSGLTADFTLKARVIFTDPSYAELAPMVGETGLWSVTMDYLADPTVSMFLSGNSPWTGYDLLTGTLQVSAASDVVTLPFGVDTDADTQAEAVYGNMYVTDGNNNWWVWNAGTSAWETWNYDSTHVPATSYNILTNAGSLYTFSETLPFDVVYEQSIQAIFGDLPKTLFI